MLKKDNIDHTPYQFLRGGGKMGESIRSVDWSQTPIGPLDSWPEPLRVSVSLMLSSPFPMYIAWSCDYIQLYNDGYRPILGSTKHPQALGISTKETFSEIWDVIGPMFAGVMKGEAVGFPNFMLPLNRHGFIEDCYFDFSYSPIYLAEGSVGGVLVTVIETTEKLKAFDDLKRSQEALAASKAEALSERDGLMRLFMGAPAGICILSGPKFVFELVNPEYQQLLPNRELFGLPLFEALPELINQEVGEILRITYKTGTRYEAREMKVAVADLIDGSLIDRYFDFIYQPRFDKDGIVDGIMVFVYEVTGSVITKQKLEDSSVNFKLLADNISQLAWMGDETGSLYWYNQRWYDFTGTDLEEMQGWGWKSMHHPDHIQRVETKWKKHIENGEIWEDTFPLKNKEGIYRWFLSRAVPLKDQNGKVVKWFGTNTDITEQRLLEQQKDDFISIASHELKTPITSLNASLQLLERMKEKLSPDMLNKLLVQSNRSANKISTLVSELLNVTKLNHGELQLSKTRFNISEMLSNCCNDIRLEGDYNIIVNGNLKIEVIADEHQIEQIMTNFVNNAVKYAPESKNIYIDVEELKGMAKVSVSDNGPGIPKEKLTHLFERYYRGIESNNKVSGLGLGLYICSEIIKRHNGQIGVNSEQGKGSTFWFMLPVAPLN
jgi:two-component system sensor histidine kinase VicK